MESPRLNQEDKIVDRPETMEEHQEKTDVTDNVQQIKEIEDSNSQSVKDRINVENSQISTHQNIESHDLSETTKSDRKSTEEVEESSSQPAQVEKTEENNVETNKNKEAAVSNEPVNEIKENQQISDNQESTQTEEIPNKDELVQGESETEKKLDNIPEESKPELAENNDQLSSNPEQQIENKIEEVKPTEEVRQINEEETKDIQEESPKIENESVPEEKVEEENKPVPEIKQNENEKEILVETPVKTQENTEENSKIDETLATGNNNEEEIREKNETKQNENVVPEENKSSNEIQPSSENEATKVEETSQNEKEEINPESSSPKQGPKDRSPKLKALRIQTQQSQDKIIVLNTEGETDQSDAPNITKYYSNENLSDLVKPDSFDKSPTNMPVKRMASASTMSSNNRVSSVDEENKEMQQPSSATRPIIQKAQKLTLEDFHKITSIGRGSYGEVFLVKKISNNKLYALKAIDKNFMKKENKEYQVYVEREVLMKLNHPNIIKLFSSFQDKAKLYFVLEYVSGGEFSDYLRINGKLSKEQIVFFSAEIVNILEYLHNFGIAHRDMKPENLLLTPEGHIKCIDFGTARFLATEKRTAELYNIKKREDTLEMHSEVQKRNHRTTFVGTAQYVSPEMLEGSECGAPADLWALGCMIYLMAVGQFPFIDINEYLIFQKIKTTTVKYPDDMDIEIKDIIQKLLVKEPTERLGAGPKERMIGSKNDYETLKKHSLFRNINFDKIHEQKPPVIEVASPHKRKSHDPDPNLTPNNLNGNRKHCHSEDLTKNDQKSENKVFDFQSDKVRVILSGLVLKKCGWLFFKPRQLILNSKPRLVYYDPDSNQLKGEIPLAQTTKAELESKTKFIVKTPNRTFVFKEMEHSAEKWVEIINTAVEQLYSKKTGN